MADLGKVMVTPKGDYSPEATYERLDLVTHHGSGYIALQDVTGIEPSDDGINWQLHAKGCKDASELPVMDTYNLLETELASETNGQALLDAIADRVANKLIAKAALANNTTTTEAGVTALDAAVGKTLQDQITQLNSNITSIYLKKRIVCNYVAQANTTTQIDVPLDSIDGYTPVLHTLDYTSNDSVVCDAGYIVNKSLLRIYLTNKTNSNISNTAGLSILYMKDL